MTGNEWTDNNPLGDSLPISAFHRRLLVCAALSVAAPLSWAQAGAGLAPHRAVYDLTLAEGVSGNGITSAEGRLVVDIDDSCDNWAASERMVLRLTSGDGEQSVYDYRFSSLEAKDGGAYRFQTSTRANGQELESGSGRAATDASGARVVSYEAADTPDLTLPAEAQFPAAQLSTVLEAAVAGESIYEGLLFDGVSDAPLSFGAAAISPVGAEPAAPDGLEDLKRWRVAAAYFDPDAPEGRPAYEAEFDLYENGVAARMTMVYDDFSLSARMSEVVIRPRCAP